MRFYYIIRLLTVGYWENEIDSPYSTDCEKQKAKQRKTKNKQTKKWKIDCMDKTLVDPDVGRDPKMIAVWALLRWS